MYSTNLLPSIPVETSGDQFAYSWEAEPVVIGMPDMVGLPFKEIEEIEQEVYTRYNRMRGLKVARGVKRNAIIREAAIDYMQKTTTPLTPIEMECMTGFVRSIGLCCHSACFREYEDETREYIAARTCKHKCCEVCNVHRSKKVRNIYRKFFEKNPDLIRNYTFMHLTLTVPHGPNGWKGKKWYSQELIHLFNKLRKKREINDELYGGEYGIEVTRNNNGFHIHIHSLLLVRKFDDNGNFIEQNRNKLYPLILKEWNKLTTGSSSRSSFSTEEIEGIRKGNENILSYEEIEKMDPSGATFIDLMTLYTTSKTQRSGYKWSENLQTYYKNVDYKDGEKAIMQGIMECMKYHFEPMAMMDNGVYDFDLLRELLPATKGKRLYGKFGAFYASAKNAHPDAHMLSLSYKSEAEELISDLEENAREEVTHPETGEVVDNSQYSYLLVSMAKIFFDADDEYRMKFTKYANPNYLHVSSCREALKLMEELGGKASARGRGLNVRKRRERLIKQPKVISHVKIRTICSN